MKLGFTTTIAAALFLGVVALNSTAVHAASCKGMSENACAAETSCTWVEGYKRADGREVRPYCRNRPSKSSAELIQIPKKADS